MEDAWMNTIPLDELEEIYSALAVAENEGLCDHKSDLSFRIWKTLELRRKENV